MVHLKMHLTAMARSALQWNHVQMTLRYFSSTVFLISTMTLVSCGQTSPPDPILNTWTAFVYPKGTVANEKIILRGFVSLETCNMARTTIAEMSSNGASVSSECGFKCQPDFNSSKPFDFKDVNFLCESTID